MGGLYVRSLGPTKLSSCVRKITSYLQRSTYSITLGLGLVHRIAAFHFHSWSPKSSKARAGASA